MDGNTAVDTANGVDWDTKPFPYPRSDFNLTQNEIDLVQGSKYLQQSTWSCTSNEVTPQKVELLSGSTAINNFPDGHQVGFFDFTRQAPNGDAFIDYVFSRGTPPASLGCPTLPARQTGDVVVTFTLTNGGSSVAIALARWNGSGFDNIGVGTGGVNWMAAESAGGTFFEGGIDFTNVFFNGTGGFTCHAFASVYMDSRSSGSGGTSEMKDVSGLALPPFCKNPTVATQSHPAGGGVAAGSVAHDVATVTGVAGSGVPTGSVDFHLCGPLASATGCTTGGTDIGSTSTSTPGADISGNPTATYTSADTSPIDALGTYCWRADYTAGQTTNYNNATGPIDAAHECFTVVGGTTTSTASSVTGAQLPGVTATDTATVTLNSPASGPSPTGTVTFKLCDPSAVCTQVGSPITLVSGSATSAAVSGTTTPNTLAIGKYCWEATYHPTGNYLASAELSRPYGECFTTGKNPTVTTTLPKSQTIDSQSVTATVQDNASVSVFVPANVSFSPGTVIFRLYGPSATANCESGLVYTSAPIPGTYTPGNATAPNTGNVTATTGAVAPAGIKTPGTYWWVATYSGDAYNAGSSSPCGDEAVHSVDANIAISPLTATNAVGTAHTFTATVKINAGDGAGYVPAPNGTTINFSLSNSNGATASFVGGISSCLTTGGTGSCHVSITSPTAGKTTITATTTLSVLGVSLTRTTGDTNAGDSASAVKIWVDANIAISPLTATNAVGTPHTFTGTVKVNAGDGAGYVPAPNGTTINFSLSNSNGATATFVGGISSCLTTGGTGSCQVSITSPTAGKTTITATTTLSVLGVSLTRTTGDTNAGDSASAVKTWVDANIAISPLTATNAVGTPHTFTATVKINAGDGEGYVPAPNGTTINFSLSNSGGATATFVGGISSCLTTGGTGSCDVSITSPTAGTTTITATTTLSVLGVSLTRTTGDTNAGDGPSAVKTWVDASIAISPLTATNVIKHQHVFTIVVTAFPAGASPVVFDSVTTDVKPAPTTQSNTCNPAHWVVNVNTLTCTLTINSNVVATYTANATANLHIGGVALTRTTSPDGSQAGPGGSGPAVKHYIAPVSTLVKAERDVTTPDTTTGVPPGGFSAGPITAHPLDVLEYRLTYTNGGQGAASQVTVTDVVPVAHSAYVAGSCTGGFSCSYDSGSHTVTWDLGTVNGGGTQVVMTFQIKLTAATDFPAGVTTQISNAAVVTTFEEGSLPSSNTVVAKVLIPVQQVLGIQVTLPQAGFGPLQQIMGESGSGGVIAFAGTLLLAMICAVVYESVRRQRVDAEDSLV
jgi:hypothetical protein